jgi:hypothetical protein
MKKSSDQYPDYLSICIKKATMGFEPMIRVLQTLAFPLGHVATMKSKKERAMGLEPTTFSLARRHSTN